MLSVLRGPYRDKHRIKGESRYVATRPWWCGCILLGRLLRCPSPFRYTYTKHAGFVALRDSQDGRSVPVFVGRWGFRSSSRYHGVYNRSSGRFYGWFPLLMIHGNGVHRVWPDAEVRYSPHTLHRRKEWFLYFLYFHPGSVRFPLSCRWCPRSTCAAGFLFRDRCLFVADSLPSRYVERDDACQDARQRQYHSSRTLHVRLILPLSKGRIQKEFPDFHGSG